MAKKNFNDLISKSFNNKTDKSTSMTTQGENESAQLVPFDRIKKNPLNTDNDKSEDTIQSLKVSIKTLGLIEPPIVYKDDDSFYMLISGEGRITAIGKLKEEEKCFENILCKVIPKPANDHMEKLLIMSANEQRNAPSFERTHNNIKEMCKHAKILADEGKGEFNDLIRGMTLLKKSAMYNYNKIYNNLIEKWFELFDQDKISVKEAIMVSGYSRGDQHILFEQYQKPGFLFEKEYIENILRPYEKNSQKLEIEELDKDLQKKKKEKQKLEKKIRKQEMAQEQKEEEKKEEDKEPEKEAKKTVNYRKKLQEKEKELSLAMEKLKRAEQMLPVFSDEEMEKARTGQALEYSIKSLQQQIREIEKMAVNYKKRYDNIPAECSALLRSCGEMIEKI